MQREPRNQRQTLPPLLTIVRTNVFRETNAAAKLEIKIWAKPKSG
jgi:hypothetical protein